MKKIINTILSLIMIISILSMCCIFAYAEDSVENWSYDTSTNTLTISGTGEIAGFVNADKTYFYDVENLIIEEGITGVGKDAFYGCTNLKNVQFPDSLKTIEANAFRDTAITELTIPKNVSDVSSFAFSIESLEIVNIYAESIRFSSEVFYYANVQRVNINSLSNWCAYDFSVSSNSSNPIEFADLYLNGEIITDLIIPDGVTTIDFNAFCYCNSIESVTISKTVESIKSQAFKGCENLKYVYIPNNVKGIANNAFLSCDKLTDIYYEGTKEEFNNLFTKTTLFPNVTVVHYLNDHEHNFEQVSVVAPKCTATGYTKYKCTICGDTYRGNITDKLEHNYTTQITEPTCVDEGYTLYTCSMCGKQHKDNITDILEHSYTSQIIEPTCVAEGYTLYTCTMCGDEYRGNITDKLEHDYTTKIIEPSCIEKGYTLYTCIVCGKETKADYTDVIKHNYSLNIVEPTCTTEGTYTYTCTICNDIVVEYIDPLPHFYKFDSYAGEFYRYSCVDCGRITSKHENNMPEFIDYVNTYVSRGNKNMYLDVVPDGIINAKDFAKIRHLSKYGW